MQRVLKMDWRLTSIRDVMNFLFVSLPASGIVALLGTLTIVLDHAIPWNEYLKASLNWWVGDAVAITCITPFCMVFLMPAVRRFHWRDAHRDRRGVCVPDAQHSREPMDSPPVESVPRGVIAGSLWVVLGPRAKDNHDLFYLFFLPVIWIAVRRGLRGATTVLMVDVGIVLSLRISRGDPSHFAMLQFLMLILSVTGLVLGSLISERDRTESHLLAKKSAFFAARIGWRRCLWNRYVGNCTFCNPAFLRLAGDPSQQALLGRNIHDVIHHTRQDGSPFP